MLPIVCIPGLLFTPRLYAEQLPALWRFGPVTVAQHSLQASVEEIAQSILDGAPKRFALIGLSMGGYVSFEILRRAAERVEKLALLDTSARPDSAEQTANRRIQIERARSVPMSEIADALFPRLVDRSRWEDEGLRKLFRQMAEETGAEGFIRQQTAILNRPDSRPGLREIGCPTLVVVGEGDELTPPELAAEIADGVERGRLVKVAACGHTSTLEQPEAVTAALVKWLED
ncbi:MAG: alpha/beta fold hydrolase [Acidobacteriaceae bacterium]